jgi:hypothetical protein
VYTNNRVLTQDFVLAQKTMLRWVLEAYWNQLSAFRASEYFASFGSSWYAFW